MKNPTVSFKISNELKEQVQSLPRNFNLSEKLRLALVDIMHDFKHSTEQSQEQDKPIS